MFLKFFSTQRPIARFFGTLTSKETQCQTVDRAALAGALKKLYAEPASIPVAIGNQLIFTGDEQHVRMPHNRSCIVTKFCYATKNHINSAIQNAVSVQEAWSNTDVKDRAQMFYNAADMLSATEKRVELMSAIVLNQAKTGVEAENDVCKMILMIRKFADGLLNLSKLKPTIVANKAQSNYILRPLDGFVAACGPHGAFQFLPSNYKLFLNTVTECDDLAAINYAGRVATLRDLWHDLSIRLPHYKCFPRLVGECDSKGYHFVHESAEMNLVVKHTIHAAFANSGQRTHCCGRLYVPTSRWFEICCELRSVMETLKIGDPADENTYASALMREDVYDNVTALLEYAKKSDTCTIVKGGNFNKTHGFFVEPTLVLCNDPTDRMMVEEIMGPVLCIYIYDDNKLDDALETLKKNQQFGSCGSIYSSDSAITDKLLNKLRMTASNLYVNEECCGQDLSYLPLSGNRLSGTNDKISPEYYLLRFASPQLIERSVEQAVDAKQLTVKKSSC